MLANKVTEEGALRKLEKLEVPSDNNINLYVQHKLSRLEYMLANEVTEKGALRKLEIQLFCW